MADDYKKTGIFEMKESFVSLLAIFISLLFFSILICFYPGPAGLGNFFWVLFILALGGAVGLGIKLLSLRPILQVTRRGIKYFRSGIEINWNQFQRATLAELGDDDNSKDEYLIIYYYMRNNAQLQQIEMKMNFLYDKGGEEIIEAIRYFKPATNQN